MPKRQGAAAPGSVRRKEKERGFPPVQNGLPPDKNRRLALPDQVALEDHEPEEEPDGVDPEHRPVVGHQVGEDRAAEDGGDHGGEPLRVKGPEPAHEDQYDPHHQDTRDQGPEG